MDSLIVLHRKSNNKTEMEGAFTSDAKKPKCDVIDNFRKAATDCKLR